ncbi:MFS transporter [Dongia sp.]|uniref:MFS transporter n=1 Tax=Dongia sp. TaxID=1977262 RepID=UPI0035B19627
MLMPSLDTSIANVSLPSLGAIFAAPFQSVQWVVLSYLLTITSLIVGAGRLGDLIGRRRLLLVGILIFTAASLACGLAPTLPLLIAARGLQGLGAAIMMALTVALVSGTVPKERTGRAMGLLGTMSAVGTSLGPSLGGLIVAHADWRFIFLINVPLGLLNWGLAAHALPRDVNRARDAALPSPAADVKKPRFDPWGTLLLAATLGAYALAMTVGEGAFGAGNVALLAAAVLGMLAFIATERRVAAPLLRLSLFRREGLSLSLALTLIVAAVVMGTFVVGPFYLSAGLGLSAGAVGLTMSAGPLMSALAGVPAGRLVDRFGARRMMLQGLIGMVLGLAALCSAPMLFGVAGYVGAIMLTTSHYALFQAANNTGIMHGVGADERGLVSGMLSLARNLGLVTGAALLGAIFAYGAGGRVTDGIDPAAITHGLRLAFGSVGTVLCLGLVAALLPRRPKASTRD